MDSDLSTQLVAARTAGTQSSIQTAIFKKSVELDTSVVTTLMETALAAPPPGQGTKVDKLA
ncbi:hypothetical protein [uncultured Devosia sp.]|uniref:hypothetical protein n=1 Tax=uncultured Devosia sp. TaxID=211434 RepID=UPI0035CB1617